MIADALRWRGIGAWGPDGTILFTPSWDTPLYRMPLSGGTPAPATRLEAGETSHRNARFLPNGRFLFHVTVSSDSGNTTGQEGIYAQGPALEDRKIVLPWGGGNTNWSYADGKLLTYSSDPFTITSRRLDPWTLQLDDPVQIALPEKDLESIHHDADLDVVAFVERTARPREQLTWYDRAGNVLGTLGQAGSFFSLALSPDEGRVVVVREQGIRVLDLRRGMDTMARQCERCYMAQWSADGRSLLFSVQSASGKADIVETGPEGGPVLRTLVKGHGFALVFDVSADGECLLYDADPTDNSPDLWLLNFRHGGKPVRVLDGTPGSETWTAALSPDRSLLAYASNESGRYEVYLKNLTTGRNYAVTASGATEPRWRADGRELFCATRADEIVAVRVTRKGDDLILDPPQRLFKTPLLGRNTSYDVTRDGQRFLVITGSKSRPTSATVLVHWFDR